METVTDNYLMGIKEGRETLTKYGTADVSIAERIENIRATLKGFSGSSSVGQMLKGELDFWRNQLKVAK